MKLTVYFCIRISEAILGAVQRRLETSPGIEEPAQPHMVRGSSFYRPKRMNCGRG